MSCCGFCCSFCGKQCGDYACNTLEEMAVKAGTGHDAVYTEIILYEKRHKTGYLSLAAINRISPKLMSKFIQQAKAKQSR